MTETEQSPIHQLVSSIETELLPELHVESLNPVDAYNSSKRVWWVWISAISNL